MVKPSQFILDTDYATLKNDTSNIAQVTIPANSVIPANGYTEHSVDIVAGLPGSLIQAQIGDTYMGQVIVGNQVVFDHSTATPYSVLCMAYRINATTVRCTAYRPNPYNTNTTGINQAITYTFYIDTFLPPFS